MGQQLEFISGSLSSAGAK